MIFPLTELPSRYRIHFAPPGSILKKDPVDPTVAGRLEWEAGCIPITQRHIALDVGNDLRPGVLDHHHFRSNTSATQLVFEKPEYVLDWVDLSGEEPITLVMHQFPDIDCMTAAFFTVCLLEAHHRDASIRKLDPEFLLLAKHVTYHDQGYCVPYQYQKPTPYFCFQFLDNHCLEEGEKEGEKYTFVNYTKKLNLAFRLFAHVIEQVRATVADEKTIDGEKDFYLYNMVPFDAPFDVVRQEINVDYQNYTRMMDDFQKVRIFSVQVQQQGTRRPVWVDGIRVVDPDVPRGKKPEDQTQEIGGYGNDVYVRMFKVWARMDVEHAPRKRGFDFLWVIYKNSDGAIRNPMAKAERSSDKPELGVRHVLSVPPGKRLNLKGLGALLNRMELQKRMQEYADVPLVPEGKKERYPGVRMEDPWYDGRGHEDTIVDTPRAGTVLSEKEIESAVQNFTVLENLYYTRLQDASCELSFLFSLPGDVNVSARLGEAGFVDGQIQENQLWSWAFTEMFSAQGNHPLEWYENKEKGLHILGYRTREKWHGLLSVELRFSFQPRQEPYRKHPFVVEPNRTQTLLKFNHALLAGSKVNPKKILELVASLETLSIPGIFDTMQAAVDVMEKLEIAKVTLAAPAWRLVFSSLHESRHPTFPLMLFAAFYTREESLDHVQHADVKAMRKSQRIGENGCIVAGTGGMYLFLNEPDSQLDPKEISEHEEIFHNIQMVGRYHAFVQYLWKTKEAELVSLLQKSRTPLHALHALRREALKMDAQLVGSVQSSHVLVDTMEKQLTEGLQTETLRKRLLDGLDDLDEYLTSREELVFQRRLTFVSVVLLPLTLLADYLGSLLFDWKPHFTGFGVSLGIIIIILLILYFSVKTFIREEE